MQAKRILQPASEAVHPGGTPRGAPRWPRLGPLRQPLKAT
jgi:hypothetical protein